MYLNGQGVDLSANDGTLSADAMWRNTSYGVYLSGTAETLSGSSIYGNSIGIYAYESTGTVISGNEIFDNSSDGVDDYYYGLVKNNQAWGNAGIGIYVVDGPQAIGNTVWGNTGAGINAYDAVVRGNTAYDNGNYGLYDTGYATLQGNDVYGNALGGVYMSGGSQSGAPNQLINNLIEANAGPGVLVSGVTSNGANPMIENNTIVSTLYEGVAGSGIAVQGSASGLQIENNILDVSSGGYAITVTQTSEQGFKSDYNLFMLSNGSDVAYWENQSFATQTTWYYEVGFDPHSQMGSADFVNLSADANGAIGWDGTQVAGSVATVDNGAATYSQSGSWTTQNVGAGGTSAYTASTGATQSAEGQASATTASWTFTGLTAGYYEIAVTWPYQYDITVNGKTEYFASNATFTAYDGSTVVGEASLNELTNLTATGTGNFTDPGTTGPVWHATMLVQVSGTSLTVTLDNVANENLVVADAVHIARLTGVLAQNNDAQLQPGSPAIDGGDPGTPFLMEPYPNGNRVDIGAYGNTAQATASTNPQIQVLNPTGLAKVQVGSPVSVALGTVGLLPYDEVARLALGSGNTSGTNANGWSYQSYRTDAGSYTTTSGTINLNPPAPSPSIADSQYVVANTAPASVFSALDYATGGVGSQMSFQLPVNNGSYQLVLEFVEPYSYVTAGQRQFDILINGQTVAAKVDVVALAGGYNKALALAFNVTVSGGTGITLQLVNDTASYTAMLSGIEVRHLNPQGVANPQVNLQLSTDGGTTWNTIATGVTLDPYGDGVFNWTPTAAEVTSGNTALIRATASLDGVTTAASGTSAPFLIANAGNDYYVSVTGNDANSGKDPADPMASLAALLRAYTLEPGDVIHVGSGTYNLISNAVLTAADDGVTIEGSTAPGDATIFNRGNTNAGAYVFELDGATGVTLENLNITGGDYGVYADTGSASTHDTVANSFVYGNAAYGVYINTSNDYFTLTNTQVYLNGQGVDLSANDGTLSADAMWRNTSYGVYLSGTAETLSGSSVYGNSIGIYAYESTGTVISGNEIFDNSSDGVDDYYYGLVKNNQAWGNAGIGIYVVDGPQAIGNTVWGNTGAGINAYDAVVRGNTAYDNGNYGLYDTGYATLQGNDVYGNALGGVYMSGGSQSGAPNQLINNLIEANAGPGVLVSGVTSNGANPIIENNTIVSTLYEGVAGSGIAVQGSASGLQIENNILDVSSGGYAITVTQTSEQGFKSDYNLFMLSNGSDVAYWENQSFATQTTWYYEVGFDPHSQMGSADFVNLSADANGAIGWDGTQVAGSVATVDNGAATYSQSGSWTTQNVGAGGTSAYTASTGATQSAKGQASATTASWTFTGLTAGYYEIAVTWP